MKQTPEQKSRTFVQNACKLCLRTGRLQGKAKVAAQAVLQDMINRMNAQEFSDYYRRTS